MLCMTLSLSPWRIALRGSVVMPSGRSFGYDNAETKQAHLEWGS